MQLRMLDMGKQGKITGQLYIWILCAVLLLFLLFSHNAQAHPLCMNGRPPFKADGELLMCPEYADFGCCSIVDHSILINQYEQIQNIVPADLWTSCSTFVRDFLCQTCSPYSAHLFDVKVVNSEQNFVDRVLPMVCWSYCSQFFNTCGEIINVYVDILQLNNPKLAPDAEILKKAYSEGISKFCEALSLVDSPYCFPKVLDISDQKDELLQASIEGCMCVEKVGDKELMDPIILEHANDGSNRMFVVQEMGLIYILYPDGTFLEEPFLDISDKVSGTKGWYGKEPAVFGMAFHPSFKENGLFYLYLTKDVDDTGSGHTNAIVEFKVLKSDGNKTDPEYSRQILQFYQQYTYHHGGQLLFGADNYLYIFLGDGDGDQGDRMQRAQNMTIMQGKVLRLDVDNPTAESNYSIPPDNPFLNPLPDGTIARPEVYAYGLRNPWRCGIDSGDPFTGAGKGRIICGDVGQNKWEELDLIENGANYGWNNKEGTHRYCFRCNKGIWTKAPTDPIYDYPHKSQSGNAVIGGRFYRGCRIPQLDGVFVYGDFNTGQLFGLSESSPGYWESKEITMCGSDLCHGPFTNNYAQHIFSFGQDDEGEIYILSSPNLNIGKAPGYIYRLVDPLSTKGPGSCETAKPTIGLLPQKLPIIGEPNSVIAKLSASVNADVPTNEQVLTTTAQDGTNKQETQDDILGAATATTMRTMPTTEPELTSDLSQPDAIETITTTEGLAEPLSPLNIGHTSEGCLCLEKIGENALQLPTILTHANDGSKRVFVGELAGVVNIYYPNGLISPEPFIDIRPRMKGIPDDVFVDHTPIMSEYGLIGMAFHPDFSENGLFYLHFTRQSDQPGPFYRTTVGEFRVSSADSEKADPTYFRVIIDINKDTQFHDGGQILFGDDGYLYAFIGDGGQGGDPTMNAQNLQLLMGKVLRVDVDNPTENASYSIPSDNPFLTPLPDGIIARPEIFAYGFRNPWRCGIDTGDPITGAGKGRIVCGDVGQGRMEELDLIEKGGNYGWNNFEGTNRYCFRCQKGIPGKTPTDPIHVFERTLANRAVIGGHFYRGCSIQNIDGAFVYGHFGDGKIFRLLETSPGDWENQELAICAPHQCQGNLTSTYAPWIISFGLDEDDLQAYQFNVVFQFNLLCRTFSKLDIGADPDHTQQVVVSDQGEIYLLSTYDPAIRNHNNGNIYRLVDPAVTAEQIESCRSKQKDLDLNKPPKTGLSIEQINSLAHSIADAAASQVHVGTAASEIDAAASEVGTIVNATTTTASEFDIATGAYATASEVNAPLDTTTTAASAVDTTTSKDATASEVDTTVDATTLTASAVDTTTTKDATASEVDTTVYATTTAASKIETATSEDSTASEVAGIVDATSTTASAVDTTTSEEHTATTTTTEVDTIGSGVIVTATESDTHTTEVGTTANEEDNTMREVINTTSESATPSSETGTTAGAVDNTVSEVDATYLTSPITTARQPSEPPSTVASSTTPMPTAGFGTAPQELLFDTFQEENYEPIMTTDENNIENNVESSIVPIVGETEAIPDTAAENIIENMIEELIDDIEYKVFVKLFPFGSIRTVIRAPNSPEAAETTLDNSNSSEDENRNESDNDDDDDDD